MSHYIIKCIKVDDNGIATVTAASNNVTPRTYHTSEMDYRSKHNPFNGKLGTEVEILKAYEEGQFQGGSNKYCRALQRLEAMPEYARFDWRKDWKTSQASRTNDAGKLFTLLAEALA